MMLVYCTGISQPPNSTSRPPSFWCSLNSGVRFNIYDGPSAVQPARSRKREATDYHRNARTAIRTKRSAVHLYDSHFAGLKVQGGGDGGGVGGFDVGAVVTQEIEEPLVKVL